MASVSKLSSLVVHDISKCIRPGLLNSLLDYILRDTRKIILVCGSEENCLDGILELCQNQSFASQEAHHRIDKVIERVFHQHVNLLRELKSAELRARRFSRLTDNLEQFREFVDALLIIKEISSFSKDQIVAAAATSTCYSVLAALSDRREKNVDVDYINETHVPSPRATFVSETLELESVSAALSRRIKQSQSQVILVSGYFDIPSGHLLDRFGTMYSNICALLINCGGPDQNVNIWNTEHYFFTGPRLDVNDASLLHKLTYDEATQVLPSEPNALHPLSIALAKHRNSSICIRNAFDILNPGTQVGPPSTHKGVSSVGQTVAKLQSAGRLAKPTAIRMVKDIILLNVCSNQTKPPHIFLGELFAMIARTELKFLFTSTSNTNVTLALPCYTADGCSYATDQIERFIMAAEDENIGTIVLEKGFASISVIGETIGSDTVMMGRCCEAISREGINIEMISSSASRLSFCAVIRADVATYAVKAVHREFF